MRGFDIPGVSLEGKTTDENIQSLNAWGINVSEQLNYQLLQMQSQIDALMEKTGLLKEENDG